MSGKPAARQTDPTSCPVPGHGTNPIATGSPNVILDNLPAARMTDTSACGSPIVGAVVSTVLINGLPAATLGSTGGHGFKSSSTPSCSPGGSPCTRLRGTTRSSSSSRTYSAGSYSAESHDQEGTPYAAETTFCPLPDATACRL